MNLHIMDNEATSRYHPEAVKRARRLRKPLSPPEAKLWHRIRNGQIKGFAFRRQHPIGPFVADFYCSSPRLVVELDGDTHADRLDYDTARTQYMNRRGFRVVRFLNRDVLNNLEGVLEAILSECEAGINRDRHADPGEKRYY